MLTAYIVAAAITTPLTGCCLLAGNGNQVPVLGAVGGSTRLRLCAAASRTCAVFLCEVRMWCAALAGGADTAPLPTDLVGARRRRDRVWTIWPTS